MSPSSIKKRSEDWNRMGSVFPKLRHRRGCAQPDSSPLLFLINCEIVSSSINKFLIYWPNEKPVTKLCWLDIHPFAQRVLQLGCGRSQVVGSFMLQLVFSRPSWS